MCIDDITGLLAEWALKKLSGNIIWNVKNVFTSEYKSRLFISPHNYQKRPVVQKINLNRNDRNADIINLVDASYVKHKVLQYWSGYRVYYKSSP